MLKFIKSFFVKAPEAPAPVAEYKVETPVVKPVADDVTRAMLESIPAPVPAKEPVNAKKVPAAKKVTSKVEKAPAVKKTRAPRKPKAE